MYRPNKMGKQSMTTLPTEIILDEILPKVDVISLFTFKLVCKCFNTQISSQKFISRHVRHAVSSSNTTRLLFLNTTNHGLRAFDLYTFKSLPLNIPYPETKYSFKLNEIHYIGSCNGLLCIGYLSDELILLLNPLTGVSFQVPHYYNFQPQDEGFSLFDPAYGFGFDSLNNDYKIVRVTEAYSAVEKVMVYRLRDNSWRQVVAERKGGVGTCVKSGVTGALIDTHLLHWVYSASMSWKSQRSDEWFPVSCYRIGCFDVSTERWANDVPLPPDVVVSTEQWPTYTGKRPDDSLFNEISCSKDLTLRILDRCLCLLVSNKGVDIWVMKEYCVKESWVKLFKLTDLSNMPVFPLCYRKNSTSCGQDEILVARGCTKLHANHDGVEVKWYNMKDQNNKTWLSEIHDVGDVPHFYEAFTCAVSLVPLIAGNPVMDEKQSV